MGEWLLAQHFHGIHTAGGDEGGGFAVGAGQVWDDDVAALGVGGVGPVGEGDFQRAAGFGFAGSVGAPGHDRFLEAEQGEVAEEVLPVFLGDVDDGAAVVGHAGAADEVLGVGEQVTPLGGEDVDDVEAFAGGLQVGAVAGEEVDVGVAGVPAASVGIGPTAEADLEFALAGLDFELGAQRFVFEAAGSIHLHAADGQPALAAAVDVGVGGLVHAQVAADVGVPGVVAGVEVVVVAVGLVGDALGRAEVDAAGQRLAGGVVDDAGVDPVAALLGEAEAEAGRGVDGFAAFEVCKAGGSEFVGAAGDVDLGGGDAGDLRCRRGCWIRCGVRRSRRCRRPGTRRGRG